MANSKVHTSKARMGMANIFGNEIIPVPEPDIETFRISLFGAPSVGKSSLICQVCDTCVNMKTYVRVLRQLT